MKSDAELAAEKTQAEEREKLWQEQKKQAEEFAAVRKERIRKSTNEQFESRIYLHNRQPEDKEGKPIGNRGYKWQQNFKGGDGNWFAEYRANVGGTKLRIFAISEQEWWEEWEISNKIREKYCPNCTKSVFWRKPTGYNDTPLLNTCPHCNQQYNVTYYGDVREVIRESS